MSRASFLAIACCLTILLPGIAAHRDPGVHPVPFASTGLDLPSLRPHADTADPVAGDGLDRVAGWYEGSDGLFVDVAGSSVPFGQFLCDLEVLGTGAGDAADESVVDGSTAGGGQAPDGLWNDAGSGAACHLPAGYYELEEYNTGGCNQYGPAHAEDAISGADIWIVTNCDSTTSVVSGQSLLSYALQTAACAAGEALSSDVDGAVGCVATFLDCTFGTDLGDGGCIVIDPVFCGADGVADASEAGQGGGHSGAGVPFPPAGVDPWSGQSCDADAAASVFVFSAVVVDVAPDGTITPHASLATRGWIA